MVLTRNQSQAHQVPLATSIHPEWGDGGSERIADKETGGRKASMISGKRCRQQCLAQDSSLVSFINETSIHGVKYIAQESRHWSERLFWLVAFLLGVSSSAYLIHGVWDRYQQTPVIVTFDVNELETGSIPFPAVTICNVNLISKRLVNGLEITLAETNSSDPKHIEAQDKLEFVRFLCEKNISGESGEGFYHGKRTDDIIAILLNNTDPCDEMIKKCSFNGNSASCSSMFKPIITDMGKCCTFNMLPLALLFKRSSKASKDGGRRLHHDDSKSNPIDAFIEGEYFTKPVGMNSWLEWQPWKQRRAGRPFGLSILIDSKLDDYFCPVSDSEGVRFTLHSPFEMPQVIEFSSAVPLGKQSLFDVIADITKVDADIRDYPQETRKCFFGNEKQLAFHRPYTRGNCIAECTADYLARQCGCSLFYKPNYHLEHMGKTICSRDPSSDDDRCLREHELRLSVELDSICPGCDPLCENVKYSHQMSMADLLSSFQLFKENPDSVRNEEEPRHTVAIVHIFFGSERTVPKLRKALYGWADLIANTGGILGLCLGFSVISGIELVYFFTLRTFWNKRDQGDVAVRERSAAVTSLNRLFRPRSNMSSLPPDQPVEEGITRVRWM